MNPASSREPTTPGAAAVAVSAADLAGLLERLVETLATALAPRLAAELAQQQATPAPSPPTRRLLTLDELIALLPAGKTARTWKRWLYERTRHGQVPGAHKIGGRWFFDREQTIPWLTGTHPAGVDLPGEQSLDQPPMPAPRDRGDRKGGR